MLFDLAERRSRAADLLLTDWLRLDLCVVSYVDQTRVTVDLGWGKLRFSVGGIGICHWYNIYWWHPFKSFWVYMYFILLFL